MMKLPRLPLGQLLLVKLYFLLVKHVPLIRDHSFSRFTKFSGKLIFLTYLCVSGLRNVTFMENFANVLNEWSLTGFSYSLADA